MGFRLVPTSMTLNELKRRNTLTVCLSLFLIASLANYVTVFQDGPIISLSSISQFRSSTFGQN